MTEVLQFALSKERTLRGDISVPADKSITHRSILFNSIANGKAVVKLSLLGRDNLASLRIMQQLGVRIISRLPSEMYKLAVEEEIKNISQIDGEIGEIEIYGCGYGGLKESSSPLNCGNSGTTARLLCGLLAGMPFRSVLVGDQSLSKRPFKRVTEPLSQMGATFSGSTLPLTIDGGNVSGIAYESPKASAQVKSAILLTGLQAVGETSVTEPYLSRDHTERMLSAMGANICEQQLDDGRWRVRLINESGVTELKSVDVNVPGDFSSAAFFMVAGVIFPESEILIRDVGINPTRLGLYELLKRMGASISFLNQRLIGGEEVADILVRSSNLHGIEVTPADVVMAIDEIPIFSLAAAMAKGTTTIHGAEELRVKESDRLHMISILLSAFGCKCKELDDGLIIEGLAGRPLTVHEGTSFETLRSSSWKTSGDHRISMISAILELLTFGECQIVDFSSIETSFPTFGKCFENLK